MHIFIYEIDENRDYLYNSFINLISTEKKDQLLRYKLRKDFLLSLCSEVLLHYGLRKIYGIYDLPEIIYGRHQKPYFKNSDLFFNISHSGSYAVCAIDNTETGIDIQQLNSTAQNIQKLSKKVLTATEFLEMNTCRNKADYFYSIWALKESYLKYLGEGLHRSLTSISFSLNEKKIVCTDSLRHSKDLSTELNFHLQNYGPDYKLAFCTKSADYHIEEIGHHTVDKILAG